MINMISLDSDCEQAACKHLNCFYFYFWGIMVIHGCRNLGWGRRNSGITTNEDSYNVWLKTLGFPPSVLGWGGGVIFMVTSAVPGESG